MKNATVIPTNNAEWGFWGTSKRNGYDAELTWDTAFKFISKEFDLTAEQTRDFLDSRTARHLADDLSFIKGGKGAASGPTSAMAITKHLEERVMDKSWRDNFEHTIYEVCGKTYPRKAPLTKEQIFTQIAQRHLNVETLVERKSDGLDFHDVGVLNIKAALEAAYEAGRAAKNSKR